MSSSAEPTTLVLVPDEKGFRELVDGIEEPLLLQIAATEEADRQSAQPYVLPAPIADGVALQAWDRVHRTLQDGRVPPTGYRLLAPGGGYQHRRLHVAAVATSDLEVLESALQMLLRALLPDDEPDLTDLLAEIAIDYSTSPVNMVGELARVLAVLRLASEEATAVLVEALTTNSASVAGDVVLTDEQESAYQQTQGPGKVAIRPYCPTAPRGGRVPRDRIGPGREPDSSDRHVRTFGADRDFAGALPADRTAHEPAAGCSQSNRPVQD